MYLISYQRVGGLQGFWGKSQFFLSFLCMTTLLSCIILLNIQDYYMATMYAYSDLLLSRHCFLVMTGHYLLDVQGIYSEHLIAKIHVMVNWQLSKRVSANQCHMTVSQAQVHNLVRWCVFFQVIPHQLLILIDHRLNYLWCLILKALKRPYNK